MRHLFRGFIVAALLAVAGCGSDAETVSPAPTDHVYYELEIEGRTVVLDLEPNDTIVAPNYREYVAKPDGLAEQPEDPTQPSCMFRGRAKWADGRASTGPAWSALNNCAGFSGMVAIDGETWILSPGSAPDEVLISRLSQGSGGSARTATIRESARPAAPASSESLGQKSEPLTGPSKYLELVLVSDAARFEKHGLNARSDALQLASLADALYRNGTLTPSIALVVVANVVIPGGTDPWPLPATGEVDPQVLLDDFTSWANAQLPPGDDYVLLSQRDFLGATVGLAWIRGACTSKGAGVVQATDPQGFVSTVLSHELGHTLGMNHEPIADYVMSASVDKGRLATRWSANSASELAAYLTELGPNDCLNNIPQPDLSARCGDGILDAGEQCDCGSKDCTGFDPCCNGATCMLQPGAQCSDLDDCCNACQIVPQGTVCKPATPCSTESVCSGKSGKCSAPAPYDNGTACSVGGFSDGLCLLGECVSRTAQCDSRTQGTIACPVGGFNATSCTALSCVGPGATSCAAWGPLPGQPPIVLEGSSCGAGRQCYQGDCVASTAIPSCDTKLPVNACGGCETLATAPGVACNACGVTECFSGGVVCSVTDPGLCPAWVTGAFGECSESCGDGGQERSVTCQDSYGTVLPDASCAALGPKPSTTRACNLGPCITYEWLTGAFGECTVECGSGTASRSVSCVESGTATVVADPLCTAPKPATSMPCDGVCLSGFECLAGACSPIDACAAAPCQVGEVCRFTGPGTYACDDLDECGAQNGGCDPRVTCTNTRGGRWCGALDACHPATLCPAASATCPLAVAPDGTICSDQNACTTTDACVAGACVGKNPVVCAAPGACQLPATCNPSTGVCGAPLPDPRCAHCSDGVKNADEARVDCGGRDCLACQGARCTADADCVTGHCKGNNGNGNGSQCTLR